MSAAPVALQPSEILSSSTLEPGDLAAVTPNPLTIRLSNSPDLVLDSPKPPTAGVPIKILARPPRTLATAAPPSQPVASTSTAPPPPDATVPPPRDKKITLLRRPSSNRNASSVESALAGAAPGGVRAPRAASEGRGGGAHSPASSETSYRRTDSEPVLSSLASRAGSSVGVTPPRSTSPSPEPSTSSLEPMEDGSMAGAVELDEGGEAEPELDLALRAALLLPRDRFLLLRAEAEMERFLADSTMYRLPLSPPYFPSGLNSYQRLLIHRLADTFGITREVDPIQPSVWAATASAASVMNVPTGIVVLVKGALTRLPSTKLATHVPAPSITTAPSTSVSPVDSSSPSLSIVPSPPSSPTIPPPQPQFFKILPRTSHRPTSSASSSIGADEDGKGKARTLEEREAAYKEARERIFKQEAQAQEAGGVPSGSSIGRPSSAGSAYSRSSAMSLAGGRPSPSVASDGGLSIHSSFQGPSGGGTVYYPQPQSSQGQARAQAAAAALRPSAPSFDPGAGGWGAYAYATQGTEFLQQGDPYAQYAGGYAEGGYGGEGEWSRQQQQPRQHLQPPPPPPQQQQQPQRQQPYDPRFGSQQRPPYAQSQPPIQVTAPSPLPQHANWASPSPPPCSQPSYSPQYQSYASPSPYAPPHPSTLDSFNPPPPAAYARQQPLPSPALSTSSGGSYHPSPTTSTTDRGGYIMRFAEGGVVGVSGFPARSASSLSSASSSSTSRTASSSNGPGLSAGGGARLGEQAIRRSSHSASHSLSSAVSTVSVASEERSSEEGKGKEKAGAKKEKLKGEEEKVPTTTTIPRHPSLPAKPVWVTTQPPVERTTIISPASTSEGSRIASAPPSHSHTPPTQVPSPYQPYPTQDPHPSYHTPPPPPPAYPFSTTQLPTTITPQSFYPPPLPTSQPPPWWDPSNPSPPESYYPYQDHAARPSSEGGNDLVVVPEMRRPPPRSTELFDPNKPVRMRRSASERGGRRGREEVEEVGTRVEGLRL